MTHRARRSAVTICALIAATVMFVTGCDDAGAPAEPSAAGPSSGKLAALPATTDLLFVVRGPATVSGGRLTVETETVEWFTDRPQRRAGVASVSELANAWGTYGFTDDPPNAALAGGDLDTVVELSGPEVTDDGVAFDFKPLRGELDPGDVDDLAELTLFIDAAGAGLSCEKEVLDNATSSGSATLACKFRLTQSASFSVESLAQAACSAWNMGSNCSGFTGNDTPILVQAWGGGGGKGNTWGLYSSGGAGSAGYAQSAQPYGDVSGDTWYAYVGGGGTHHSDGGSGGMASLVLNQPLSQISSSDISSAVVIAGGGGGGGPANSDGNGWDGGNGGHAWAAGDASSQGGPNNTGSNPANAFAPGASTGGTVATSYNSDGFSKGPGCGGAFEDESNSSGNGYACGGSLAVPYIPDGVVREYSFAAQAGVGGESTWTQAETNAGDANIAPVGGDAPDEKMSYSDFAGGTAIDSGLASANLGTGGDGYDGGAGGGGGYGGGGGSGPRYTCGHTLSYALMYCGGAGGGSYAAGSSLGSSDAPTDWYGSLYASGSSTITVWIASL